ncbi:MAG: nicotinamide-nucleotide amidohydrolase family protein [Firmicutes bacterium]|nr:nicotinamide-nucleotide amidohydrolase family protein [Bacillota bacterium]
MGGERALELARRLGERLRQRGETLAVAESCTGGLLADRITDVPGASDYFLLGVVAYANRAKEALLGVPAAVLERHGAVSGETARAMAEGVRRRAGSDWGLATTGIAGPGGARPGKPVGLVWVATAGSGEVWAEELHLAGDRRQVKEGAVEALLEAFLRTLEGGWG